MSLSRSLANAPAESDVCACGFECVREYCERDKRGYPDQEYLDHGDAIDAFLKCFATKDGRAQLMQDGQIPLKKGEVGTTFPKQSELADILIYIDGEFSPCPARLAASSRIAAH